MVDDKIKCKKCKGKCVKNGIRNKIQRYYCKQCKHSFAAKYINNSYKISDKRIVKLLKEGCGIRSISRILEISPTTVISRIKLIAKTINPPKYIPLGRSIKLMNYQLIFNTKKDEFG